MGWAREEELQYLHCDTPMKGVEVLEIAVWWMLLLLLCEDTAIFDSCCFAKKIYSSTAEFRGRGIPQSAVGSGHPATQSPD